MIKQVANPGSRDVVDVFYVTAARLSPARALELSQRNALDFAHVPRIDMGKFYERGDAERHAAHLKDHVHLAIRVEHRREPDDR